MGAWLAIGVAALAAALAVADDESGLRTWWSLRAELGAADEAALLDAALTMQFGAGSGRRP